MRHSAVWTLAGTILLTALAAVRAPAHHGSGDEDWAIWDRQAFEVCGVVEKAEFVNPHLLVHVSFTTRNGALTTWTFTAYAPNHAVRIGVTRQKFLEWFAP